MQDGTKIRFGLITDTHFCAEENFPNTYFWNNTLCNKSLDIGSKAVDILNQLSLDFVMHCGDFTNHADITEYQAGCEILDKLNCPWHMVIGNHDVGNLTREMILQKHKNLYYKINYGKYMFLMLDSCIATRPLEFELSKAELEWLEDCLKNNKNKDVIILSHIPLVYKPDYADFPSPGTNRENSSVNTESFMKQIGYVKNTDEFIGIIEKYDHVRMLLSGHWHFNSSYLWNEKVCVTTASLVEYPMEFRVIEITENAIDIRTYGLEDPDLLEQSYKDEYENKWVSGNTQDRDFAFIKYEKPGGKNEQ